MKIREWLTVLAVLAVTFVLTAISASAIKLTEDTVINGDCHLAEAYGGEKVELNGFTFTVNGDLYIDSDETGIFVENGVLDVSGDIQQTNGSLGVQNGTINVGGNYIATAGDLFLGDENSIMNIDGSWIAGFSTGDEGNNGGVVNLKGNLQAKVDVDYDDYYEVVLRNFNIRFTGSEEQVVTSNTGWLSLEYIESTNSKLRFDPNTVVGFSASDLIINSDVSTSGIYINEGGKVTINGDLRITGDSPSIEVSYGTLNVMGDLRMERGEYCYDDAVRVSYGALNIGGNLEQYGGGIKIYEGTVNIGGNYNAAYGNLYLENEYSIMNIDGSWIAGFSVESYYGTINLKGNLQAKVDEETGNDGIVLNNIRFTGSDEQVVTSNTGLLSLGYIESTNSKLRFDPNTVVSFRASDLIINSDVYTGGIYVTEGGKVTINGDLRITGDSPSIEVSYGTLNVMGDLRMERGVYYYDDAVRVSYGALNIGGNLEQYGGGIKIYEGTVNIGGNYNAAYGNLYLENEYSIMNIDGSWIAGFGAADGNYGTINLKGDLQAKADETIRLNCKLRFVGSDEQVVTSNTGLLSLGYIESTNSKLRFDPNTVVSFSAGDLIINSDVYTGEIYVTEGGNVTINGDLRMCADANLALGSNAVLNIKGDCSMESSPDFNVNVSLSTDARLMIDGNLVYDHLFIDSSGEYSDNIRQLFIGGDLIDRSPYNEDTLNCGMVLNGSGKPQRVIVDKLRGTYLYLTRSADNYIFLREDWGNITDRFPYFDVPMLLREHLAVDVPESIILGDEQPALTMSIGGVEETNEFWGFNISYNGFDKAGTATIVIESDGSTAPVVGKVIKTVEVIGSNPVPTVQLVGDQLILEWQPVKGAAGYSVWFNDEWYHNINDTIFSVAVEAGKSYSYIICPCATDGDYYCDESRIRSITISGGAVTPDEDPDIPADPDIPDNVPAIPDNFSATADGSDILLTWDAVDGATGYSIRRYDGTDWSDIATVSATVYKDVSVETGIIYIYTVAAVNSDGSSAASEPAATIIKESEDIPELSAPKVSSEVNDNGIILEWDDVDGATAYDIFRYDGTRWSNIATVKVSCYSDIDVEEGVTYTYTVYSLAGTYKSVPSALVTEEFPAGGAAEDPVVDTTPANVKATAGEGKVDLSWDAVVGATKYRIRRNDGSGWVSYKDVATNAFTDTNVSGDTTYKYAVYAYVDGSFGKSSEIVSATPTASVIAQNVKATAGEGEIALSWSAVSGATKYRIRRNDGSGWVNYKDLTDTTYADVSVDVGTTYKYAVYSYVNGTWGGASAIVSATAK